MVSIRKGMMFSQIEEAISDLRQGKMILVTDDEGRENEAYLVIASEDASPEAINFMATYGRGLICVTIEADKAQELSLHPMCMENKDNHGTAFTQSIDALETKTGISAYERSLTIKKLLETNNENDFRAPGHVFPLVAKVGGVIERGGHTEASVDLAKLAGKKASGVICEVMADDGKMATGNQLKQFAEKHQLKIITIADLINYRKAYDNIVSRKSVAKLPTKYGEFNIIGYYDELQKQEHIALIKGNLHNQSDVLVRVHSECLTGDAFGSLRCDCGDQLQHAMETIEKTGLGIIIYLRQEGRGIGLLNKISAYTLQDHGLDTVEANEELGFNDDMREYYVAKHIINDLGIKSIKLMTNNRLKQKCLEDLGIEVSKRVAIKIEPNEFNCRYLKTKKEKMNHDL